MLQNLLYVCDQAVAAAQRSDPSRDVYVFYTDLRAYGKGFEEYYKRAQNTGVKFVRGRVAEVNSTSNDGRVTLCSMCFNTLKRANLLVREKPEDLTTINDFMYLEDD